MPPNPTQLRKHPRPLGCTEEIPPPTMCQPRTRLSAVPVRAPTCGTRYPAKKGSDCGQGV
eukprot:5095717-Prymnesium_polylepis.1